MTEERQIQQPSHSLPHALYRAAQVRRLDHTAIHHFGIAGETLMERAGAFSYAMLVRYWPQAKSIAVICGTGNNGGDGYVIARIAHLAGLSVTLLQMGDHDKLQGDAALNAGRCEALSIPCEPLRKIPHDTEVIVDAILGTGLERNVSGHWAEALQAINRHRAAVLAVDIPSGLNSDTGTVMGTAVRADVTTTFIALKQGMFTAAAADYCGEILFHALDIPARLYASEILNARRVDWNRQQQLLPQRPRSSHKGDCGHVLLVGGSPGFSGAVRLAGEGALRSGAGLVSIATDVRHAGMIAASRPELMCHGIDNPAELEPLLQRCSVVAIGPGLGQGAWGKSLFESVIQSNKPVVVDADALNLLAEHPQQHLNCVLTPHPGEAARLLDQTVAEIQNDRFTAAKRLQQRYGGVIVLKGAGTVIHSSEHRPPTVCSQGNPGMATGGSGDVLTGVIAGLIAQGFELQDAAETGVCVHAAAGDLAAQDGERGMIASDLFSHIRKLLQ
ncbi:MAG: NAD(P)H-hydrate dehydratase [Gammaproteobacteria bacterium]|nr:NAD(P)H-hydrate dehydratase [Gammaproteobacteria bacterium]